MEEREIIASLGEINYGHSGLGKLNDKGQFKFKCRSAPFAAHRLPLLKQSQVTRKTANKVGSVEKKESLQGHPRSDTAQRRAA